MKIVLLLGATHIFVFGRVPRVPMTIDVGKIEVTRKLPIEVALLIMEEAKAEIFRKSGKYFRFDPLGEFPKVHDFPLAMR